MRQEDVTYQDKFNELRLDLSHPNNRGICFVLLEGGTDIRLFKKLFNLAHCRVERIPGGNPKLEEAVSELSPMYELVIGIRDADFINLRAAPYSNPNMFLTDFHDIEMLLVLEDDCMSAIMFEYTKIPKEEHAAVRTKIVTILENISLLKWLNEIENIKLKFEAGFQDLISFDTSTIDFNAYFSRVLSKSDNASITDIVIILPKIAHLKAQNPNPYQLCNGHDFTKTLGQFIKIQGEEKGIGVDNIESMLRVKYTKENFYTTQLFVTTKAWADSKDLNIHE